MRYPQATPMPFPSTWTSVTTSRSWCEFAPPGPFFPMTSRKSADLDVGSIVLAPGAEVFDPGRLDTYGGGTYPNVVSSLEYERILSASGPTQGELLRPSDGKRPRKIAWIQCVGSRSLHDGAASYCSSACCMFALKEAMVTRERFHEDIETTIFFMDMRTFGKDYELYYQRAKTITASDSCAAVPTVWCAIPTADDLAITYVPLDSGARANRSLRYGGPFHRVSGCSRDLRELAERWGSI